MMKFAIKFLSALALVCIAWAGLKLFTYSQPQDGRENEHQKQFNQDYKIYSLVSPKELKFCKEEVPLHLLDVKEKLDRELLVNTYWQSQTMLFLKRSHRYFPIIEQILKAEGIPEDFKYLALIESGLDYVVSPAGATGFWQIMKSTGSDYGLEINSEVDERYHLVKSTQFAAEYLNDAYKRFGSWTLAAASYNMGMNGLEKQLEKQQVNNYFDLLLNVETGRYLYRILAVKQIIENPNKYGFNYLEEHLYEEIQTKDTTINSDIPNLASFAKQQEINYKILKTLNPWLRSNELTTGGKEYTISLPAQGYKGLAPADTARFSKDSLSTNG